MTHMSLNALAEVMGVIDGRPIRDRGGPRDGDWWQACDGTQHNATNDGRPNEWWPYKSAVSFMGGDVPSNGSVLTCPACLILRDEALEYRAAHAKTEERAASDECDGCGASAIEGGHRSGCVAAEAKVRREGRR